MEHLKSKQGSALVITIILLALVSILGTAMLFSITNEVKLNKAIEEKEIAKYLAEAGINHALYLVENDDGTMEYPYTENFTLEDSNHVYEIAINKDGEIIEINSTGKYEESGIIKQQAYLRAIVDKAGKVVVNNL